MTAKKVLLLITSDRFVFPLIRFLIGEGKRYEWKISIGSMLDAAINDRIKSEKLSNDLKLLHFQDFEQCELAIRKTDLVIAMVPDVMLLQVADSCITNRKNLISPSRLSRQMALKRPLVEESKVLFLLDCGFSPGLDHVTAKKAIDNIHTKGGKINCFQTYSGSLIDESSMDGPWQFKLTEPVSDVLHLGKQHNRHLINGKLQHIPYHRLFERAEPVTIRNMENTLAIPEGDSLYYRKIYALDKTSTVVKGKLVRKGFERIWNLVVKLGLTDHLSKIELSADICFYNFLDSLLPYSPSETLELRLQKYAGADKGDIEKIKWLGWFDREWMDAPKDLTFATIFQYLLEKKLTPGAADKDRVVMKHQLEYEFREAHYKFTATLIMEGDNQKDSALAKAIGFICGAAAKSILLGDITLKGLHIPTRKEIYDPILNELDDLGVSFHIEDKKMRLNEINALA